MAQRSFAVGDVVGWKSPHYLHIGTVLGEENGRVYIRPSSGSSNFTEKLAISLYGPDVLSEADVRAAHRRGGHLLRSKVTSNIPGLYVEETEGEEEEEKAHKGRGRSKSAKGKKGGAASKSRGHSRSRSRAKASTPAKKGRGRSVSAK